MAFEPKSVLSLEDASVRSRIAATMSMRRFLRQVVDAAPSCAPDRTDAPFGSVA
jgi:hypothetical protein